VRILFLGLNYAPETIGIAVYSSGLCRRLSELGHEVRVVTAKPYYPQWRVLPGYRGGWRRSREGRIDVTRCPIYVPSHPTGLRRILHHISFAASAFFPMLAAVRSFKPDVVMTVAPSLMAAPAAWLAAKLGRAPSWLHLQDFEVEAAFATGLLDERSRGARLARRLERAVIQLFNRVSSISPEMCARLVESGLSRNAVFELRNWAELDLVRPLARASAYRSEWDIGTPHVALYSGNIANKQGIELVLEAAEILASRRDLTFVICGNGPNRAPLERRAANAGNIIFRDLQPLDRLEELLGLATVHLLPQKAEAADLVLPSKLTNMLASGRPIVATAAHGTGLAREVAECGIVTPPGDARAFAAAVERLIDDEHLRATCSVNARRRAEQVWDRQRIIDRLVDALDRLLAASRQ
jgi:colanic acid biosynthesis glycosyl transferase WcaI